MHAIQQSAGDGRLQSTESARLSYKFQRLRERIRQAVNSGELSGKLPGERQLARRFKVNAKTLSKALTDLAAEGLLERSIGKGTFVRGSAASSSPATGKWLLLADANEAPRSILDHFRTVNPQVQVIDKFNTPRPSFINQFSAVFVLSNGVPDALIRELLLRGIPTIMVGTSSAIYSTHSVQVDTVLAANNLVRELLQRGHRSFLVIEPNGQVVVTQSLQALAARQPDSFIVDPGATADIRAALNHEATAIICTTPQLAAEARLELQRLGITPGGSIALVAAGVLDSQPPCDGNYVTGGLLADTAIQLLRDASQHRPSALWLRGHYVAVGTVTACAGDPVPSEGRADVRAPHGSPPVG